MYPPVAERSSMTRHEWVVYGLCQSRCERSVAGCQSNEPGILWRREGLQDKDKRGFSRRKDNAV